MIAGRPDIRDKVDLRLRDAARQAFSRWTMMRVNAPRKRHEYRLSALLHATGRQ